MALITKNLSWILLLATSFPTSFPTTVAEEEVDICEGGVYRCIPYTVMCTYGMTELREYEPFCLVTSADYRFTAVKEYINGANIEKRVVEYGLPFLRKYENKTETPKLSRYNYLPNPTNPEPSDPAVIVKCYPKQKAFARRYKKGKLSALNEDDAFLNLTKDIGAGNYIDTVYYWTEYKQYREVLMLPKDHSTTSSGRRRNQPECWVNIIDNKSSIVRRNL